MSSGQPAPTGGTHGGDGRCECVRGFSRRGRLRLLQVRPTAADHRAGPELGECAAGVGDLPARVFERGYKGARVLPDRCPAKWPIWSCFHLAETTVQVAPRGVVLHAAGVRQQLGDELRSTMRVFRGQKTKLLCDNEGEKKNTRWFDRVHVSVTPRKVTFDS